ncbi:hypothetical protein ABTK10_20685, partial [Acinetobacter baumannii]
VAIAALAFAVTHFDMTTDTSELISPKVEWRQKEATLNKAFPGQTQTALVLVDGVTPELAELGAAKLAAALADDHAHFKTVRRP